MSRPDPIVISHARNRIIGAFENRNLSIEEKMSFFLYQWSLLRAWYGNPPTQKLVDQLISNADKNGYANFPIPSNNSVCGSESYTLNVNPIPKKVIKGTYRDDEDMLLSIAKSCINKDDPHEVAFFAMRFIEAIRNEPEIEIVLNDPE